MRKDRTAIVAVGRGSIPSILAIACLSLAWLSGCEDVQFNWQSDRLQPRPIGQPVGRVVAQGTSEPSTPAAQTPQQTAAPKTEARRPAPPTALSLYQVVLFSDGGPAEAPTGQRYVRLRHARARDVAGLLAVLYLPSGPSGTDDRYTLVYPTAMEYQLAADAALGLDVAQPTGPAPTTGSTTIWTWAIGEASTLLEDSNLNRERLRRVVSALSAVLPSAELNRAQRWAAGMVAAEILMRRLDDYGGAVRLFAQAEQAAESGSYEQMAATFARGRALFQDGQRDQARCCFETVIGQFASMRGSEVFERARETLGAWDKKRQ